MEMWFFDDVIVGGIPPIVCCTCKLRFSDLKIREIATAVCLRDEERVEFRANQPTGGDLRPISAGYKRVACGRMVDE